ncbi:MAG: DUF805 domain-containing protein [Selenomonadaceae bacterium]|nr:DUF805 domain-containing protein [Selenomonadaceae bacterium]
MNDNIQLTESENATSTTDVYQEDIGLKQKFFNTRGRLNRKRYWLRVLCVLGVSYIIGYVISAVVDNVIWPYVGSALKEIIEYITFGGFTLLILIDGILILLLSIRRLHDTNNSGRCLLLNLLLFIIYLIVITYNSNIFENLAVFVFMFIILPVIFFTVLNVLFLGIQEGTEGPNQYGSDPLGNSVNNA